MTQIHHAINFDNAATTSLDPQVVQEMIECMRRDLGHPSALHEAGRESAQLIESARAPIAAIAGMPDGDVIFTSGGTEALNLAVLGLQHPDTDRSHVVVSMLEHAAVLRACDLLEERGVAVTRVPVGQSGVVDPGAVEEAVLPSTRLIAVQAAHNILGTVQPIQEIAAIARSCGALLLCDAVQAAGRIRLHPLADAVVVCAHKMHGPTGVGALVLRRGLRLTPMMVGAGQERGLRSGTPNTIGIHGFAIAAASALESIDLMHPIRSLRDRLEACVAGFDSSVAVLGTGAERLPGHVAIVHSDGGWRTLSARLLSTHGVWCSEGSIPLSAWTPPAFARRDTSETTVLRFSLTRRNTSADVDRMEQVLAAMRHSNWSRS